MSQFHLVQYNIARALAPLDSPQMAEFVQGLGEMNALAEAAPGFVWRLQDTAGDATALRPYADPLIIVNLTVWESLDSLKNYAYHSRHTNFVRRRREWFAPLGQPYLALWWTQAGQLPTLAQAQERLEIFRKVGDSPLAFSFQKVFDPAGVLAA